MLSTACAAQAMVLGFPKCGTSDLTKWFTSYHSDIVWTVNDYFRSKNKEGAPEMTKDCPTEWFHKTSAIKNR